MPCEQDLVYMTNDTNKKPSRSDLTRDTTVDDLDGKRPEEIAAELKRTLDAIKRRLEELEAADRRLEESNLAG